MPTITRKRFLALSAALTAILATAGACAGDGGGGTDGGDDDDGGVPGDDDDDGGVPTETPNPTPSSNPTNTANPSPTPFGDCAAFGTTVTITNPHGHTLDVPASDVTAGTQQIYDITGSNMTHGHTVTITESMFEQLQGGFEVMVTSSSGGGHTHPVRVRCAAS